MGGHKRAGGKAAGPQGAPGVEAKPSYPEQAGADEAKDHAMRWHGLFRVAQALSQIEGADERRDTRSNVNDRASRKIQRGEYAAESRVQKASLAPYHVRHRSVNEDGPKDHEHEHGA